MRTTLDLDPEVLVAAKELAKRQHKTAGQVVSELLRQALSQSNDRTQSSGSNGTQHGFRPFPSRGGIVTNQLIEELREEQGD
jgi:hypothetical protein